MIRSNARGTLMIAPLALSVCAGAARAQCEWRVGLHQGWLVNGNVNATALWDPDGAGPLPQRLVVGGTDITRAGNAATSNIAMYDGTSWQPLGAGLSGGSVLALASFNGELVAAGLINSAGGLPVARIAKWNGTTWSALGAGFNDTVLSLAVFNGSLYAGGVFTTAGGASANRIARWDGANWHSLGVGTSSSVATMTPLGGFLYVGGNFSTAGGLAVNHIARWTGSSWQGLGAGANGPVRTLAGYDSGSSYTLYIGGQFSTISGINANNVASLQLPIGSWSAVGAGLSPYLNKLVVRSTGAFSFEVTALAPPNASGQSVWRWANPWNALGSLPTSVSGDELIFYGGRYTLGLINGSLTSVREWDNTSWAPVGPGIHGYINAMTPFGDDLVVGGSFDYASGTRLNHIGRWNGTAWTSMAGGMNGTVEALLEFQNNVYAAGAFTLAGSTPTVPVARWNGAAWEAVGTAGSLTGTVYALAEHNGQLLLGGMINGATRVMAWNGAQWTQLGAGLATTNSHIRHLAVGPDNTLYAAGIQLAGAGKLAKYVPASGQWVAVPGLPVGANIYSLASFGGGVYIGGDFFGTAQVGGETRYYCLASVTPTQATIDTSVYYTGFGFPDPGTIQSFGVYNGALYAAGTASNVPGFSRGDLWRHENGVWSVVGTGSDGTYLGRAMAPYQGELYISGDLVIGGNQRGRAWARWYCPPAPPACYANCDGSTTAPILNVADFACFLQKFAAQDPYANCDSSTTVPILNIADFSCFLTKFAAGCP